MSEKVYGCPLCGSTREGITQEQADALTVGKALGAMRTIELEEFGRALHEIIRDQVGEVMAGYRVALVRDDD